MTVRAPLGKPRVVWEDIPCPLCGSWDEELLIAVPSAGDDQVYRVGRCRQCGLGYLNPRPDCDSIGHYYPENYEEHNGRAEYRPGLWGRTRRYLEGLVMSRHYGCPPPLCRGYERLLADVAAPWLRPARDSLTGYGAAVSVVRAESVPLAAIGPAAL